MPKNIRYVVTYNTQLTFDSIIIVKSCVKYQHQSIKSIPLHMTTAHWQDITQSRVPITRLSLWRRRHQWFRVARVWQSAWPDNDPFYPHTLAHCRSHKLYHVRSHTSPLIPCQGKRKRKDKNHGSFFKKLLTWVPALLNDMIKSVAN